MTFGDSLNPGDFVNASLNTNYTIGGNISSTAYNVTNDVLSNVQLNVTIQGRRFESGSNAIEIGNASWLSNLSSNSSNPLIYFTYLNARNLTTTDNVDQKVAQFLPVGSTQYMRFWVWIPGGTLGGAYRGNYTLTCSQAS